MVGLERSGQRRVGGSSVVCLHHFHLSSLREVTRMHLTELNEEGAERIAAGQPGPRVATVFQLLAPAATVGAINVAPGWLCVSLGNTRKQLICGLISAPVCVVAFFVTLVGIASTFQC